ncbi:MAG: zinc ribbon domain-containing protein [Candidatus Jordarchaeaceae archaeon]
MISDLRDLYKNAVSALFEIMRSKDFGLEFNALFREAEKSMHLLISSAPDVSILNEILNDAYSLAEKVAVMSPPSEKKLKRIKDKYEELINRTLNKSLVQSEEKRLDKAFTTEKLLCPECSKPISSDAEFCPYCGIELVKCTTCKSVISGNQEIVICSKCGGAVHLKCLAKNDRKCPKCGGILSGQEA